MSAADSPCEDTLEFARTADAADPLRGLRERFALPLAADAAPLAYLCGHSLGLAPRAARARVLEEIEDWERLGVLGHEQAHRPWISYAETLRTGLAALVGAHPDEVVAMNSLSVNLHLLLAGFYRPAPGRDAILIEAGAFPSDRHVVESQIRWHGLDPRTCLIELAPRSGTDVLEVEQIEATLAHAPGRIALVLWPGVQYRTGQAFDLARIVRAAHAAGAIAGFDLAHAIGNLPLELHSSGADFAAWCSYKYLNAGPGAIAGAFVHERHGELPHLTGWWGHEAATRFRMSGEFVPGGGAAGWQISNPPVLSAAPLGVALALFAEVGMAALRVKSQRLTGWLEFLLRRHCAGHVEIITPAERGCQLSLRVRPAERARAVYAALAPRGIVADWREPDVIRMAPVPLYNGYEDVWRAAQALVRASP
ncbi:MAG: kynureninase [Gammaproteobacteria bacterium]|nr:kynureninase [Gammaproteobacteria bacterium]